MEGTCLIFCLNRAASGVNGAVWGMNRNDDSMWTLSECPGKTMFEECEDSNCRHTIHKGSRQALKNLSRKEGNTYIDRCFI